jgi:uncharacterized protein
MSRPTIGRAGIEFPIQLDSSGSAADARSQAVAARALIEELLFTALGERLNRPDLGCGLLELVFDPATDELRAATQFQVTSELQRWLGDVIRVGSVVVESSAAQLSVTVTYGLVTGGEMQTAVFTR